MTDLRDRAILSLCTGAGGLDMAVTSVTGAGVAYTADNDPHAAAVLDVRYPGIPNLGDIAKADWAALEHIDVLAAGFPCQDLSVAGHRKGLREGTKSGIWSSVAQAVRVLRPGLVFIENVRGITSAGAGSDLEYCPGCMGDREDKRVRALGVVLGDLAALGYDAEWLNLTAAEAGAPHRRERVFILAWPAADARHDSRAEDDPHRPAAARHSGPAADAERHGFQGQRRDSGKVPWRPAETPGGHGPAGGSVASADAPGNGRHEGRPEPAGVVGGPDASLCGDEIPADAGSGELQRRGVPGIVGGAPAGEPGEGHQRQRAGNTAGDRRAASPGPDGNVPDWGPYTAAIERWELALGRPAPSPVVPGKSGDRLSPVFVEWMMGLPEGWVTDVPGLSRNAQLKLLGNAVVPQQAALAYRVLLDRTEGAR